MKRKTQAFEDNVFVAESDFKDQIKSKQRLD